MRQGHGMQKVPDSLNVTVRDELFDACEEIRGATLLHGRAVQLKGTHEPRSQDSPAFSRRPRVAAYWGERLLFRAPSAIHPERLPACIAAAQALYGGGTIHPFASTVYEE